MGNQSLLERYSEHDRSYYRIKCDAKSLFTGNAEEIREKCLCFMNLHYEKGKKEQLLDNDLYDKYEHHGKHTHSASLYLLGMELLPLFRQCLCEALSEFVPNFSSWGGGGADPLYIWFLPAMYHDFASCAELGTIHANDSDSHRSLQFHLGNHNILYSPYRHFPYKAENIPFRFSPELIENYFYYRACQGRCEHGIIAGYLFFDRFVKNYLKACPNAVPDENGDVKRNGLNWNVGHLTFAAYAADAIICHNIWLGGNAEKDKYMQFGLSPLLYKEHPENKLSIEKYPLQFMLCLLDTIEPIKRFEDSLSPTKILMGIGLDFDVADRTLSLSWNNEIKKKKGVKKWRDGIVAMRDWMCVDVEEKENENGVMIGF